MKWRMPTHLRFGEGRVNGEVINIGTRSICRGMWAQHAGRVIRVIGGGPSWVEFDSIGAVAGELGGESDRVIRPLRPGNAGGGKDPDFWCAVEDGKDRVIGDEPRNTTGATSATEYLHHAVAGLLRQGFGGVSLPALIWVTSAFRAVRSPSDDKSSNQNPAVTGSVMAELRAYIDARRRVGARRIRVPACSGTSRAMPATRKRRSRGCSLTSYAGLD